MFKFLLVLTLFCVCATWSFHGISKSTDPPWSKSSKGKDSATTGPSAWGKKGSKEMPSMKKGKAKPWLLKKSTTTTPAPTATSVPSALLAGSPVQNSIFISKLFDALATEIQNGTTTPISLPVTTTTTASSIAEPPPGPTPIPSEYKKVFENLILLSLLKPAMSKTTPASLVLNITSTVESSSATAEIITPPESLPPVSNWTDTAEILKLLAPQIASILQNEADTLNETASVEEEPSSAELQTIVSLLEPTSQLPVAPADLPPLLQLLGGATASPTEATSETIEDVPISPDLLPLLLQLLLQNATTETTFPDALPQSTQSASDLLPSSLSVAPSISDTQPKEPAETGMTTTEAASAESAETTTPDVLALLQSLLTPTTTAMPVSVEKTKAPDAIQQLLSLLTGTTTVSVDDTTVATPAETTTESAIQHLMSLLTGSTPAPVLDTTTVPSDATTTENVIQQFLSFLAVTTPTPVQGTTTGSSDESTAAEETTIAAVDLPTLLSKLLNITRVESITKTPAASQESTIPTIAQETTTAPAPTDLPSLISLLLNITKAAETTTATSDEVTTTETAETATAAVTTDILSLISLLSQTVESLTPEDATTTSAQETTTTKSEDSYEPVTDLPSLISLLLNITRSQAGARTGVSDASTEPASAEATSTASPDAPTTSASPLAALVAALTGSVVATEATSQSTTTQVPATTVTPSALEALLSLLYGTTPATDEATTTATDEVTTAPADATTSAPTDLELILMQILQPTSTTPVPMTTEAITEPDLASMLTLLLSSPTTTTTAEPVMSANDALAALTDSATERMDATTEAPGLLALLKQLLFPSSATVAPTTAAPDTEAVTGTATSPTIEDDVSNLLSLMASTTTTPSPTSTINELSPEEQGQLIVALLQRVLCQKTSAQSK